MGFLDEVPKGALVIWPHDSLLRHSCGNINTGIIRCSAYPPGRSPSAIEGRAAAQWIGLLDSRRRFSLPIFLSHYPFGMEIVMAEILSLNKRPRLDVGARVFLGNLGIGKIVAVVGDQRTIEYERYTADDGIMLVVETHHVDELRPLTPLVDCLGSRGNTGQVLPFLRQ